MSLLVVDKSSTAVPLDLTIEQEAIGGVTGKSPTVALRDATTITSYLDWADNTFKTFGWTLKDAPMTEVGDGHYQRSLSLPPLSPLATAGSVYAAQYHVDDGADVKGVALDIVIVEEQNTDMSLIRKSITNRMEEFPGNPGHLILFDDDGFTQLKNWELRDAAGGAVVATVGTPAKRAASTI